jgi:hypothetical protein
MRMRGLNTTDRTQSDTRQRRIKVYFVLSSGSWHDMEGRNFVLYLYGYLGGLGGRGTCRICFKDFGIYLLGELGALKVPVGSLASDHTAYLLELPG